MYVVGPEPSRWPLKIFRGPDSLSFFSTHLTHIAILKAYSPFQYGWLISAITLPWRRKRKQILICSLLRSLPKSLLLLIFHWPHQCARRLGNEVLSWTHCKNWITVEQSDSRLGEVNNSLWQQSFHVCHRSISEEHQT